jgi:hypothetical protein
MFEPISEPAEAAMRARLETPTQPPNRRRSTLNTGDSGGVQREVSKGAGADRAGPSAGVVNDWQGNQFPRGEDGFISGGRVRHVQP